MPFVSLTKGAKQRGVQTYRNAVRLPEPLREAELDYLDLRDWYSNQMARREQFEEALEQAKKAGDAASIGEFRNKIHTINSSLVDVRDRVRKAGERSYAEAFMLAARCMLPGDVRKRIEEEAARLLGRGCHEFTQ